MATTEIPTVADSTDLDEQLRAAIDLLERIAADWRLLDRLTSDDRRRFHQAIARLSEPDPRAKRKRQKAAKAAGVRRGEAVLNQTGIRTLRRRPVVTTPNVFPPERFEAHDVDHQAPAPNDDPRTANNEAPNLRPRLLRLQEDLHARPRLLRSALPRMRRLQFRRAHGARGLARPCRAAHRRARQDRLPGRPEAPPLRRAPHRHDPVPAERRGALRAGGRLRRLESPTRNLRSGPARHALRGGVLPRPRRLARAPRLHRQQRLPDRPASA